MQITFKKIKNINEFLTELKRQLSSMMEIIDNYKMPIEDVIIISKDDLTDLKYIKKLNSYLHLFEYKITRNKNLKHFPEMFCIFLFLFLNNYQIL